MRTLKKIFKWTGLSLLVVIIVLTIAVASKQNQKYDAPFPEIHASKDSLIISRGEYLFYGPAHCLECHTNVSGYAKVVKGERLDPAGGMVFTLPIGVMRSPNITSDKETGIGKFTDTEIARTLRYGVGKDGRAIFDFMPFHNTSDEDLTAIISFLRTLPPVKNEVPRVELNVLGKIINAFVLKPVGPDGEVAKKVAADTTVEYGRYLAHSVANCYGCHTNRDLKTGAFIGEPFAGGFKMDVPGKPGTFVVTRNITPDPEKGHIYDWTETRFIQRFRTGSLIDESLMPWGPFGHMSDNDLKAIYRYLQTVKPSKNDPGPVLINE